MAPPHLLLVQREEGEKRESSLRCKEETKKRRLCAVGCAAVSPIHRSAGVWVNTEYIEIHHWPWSATSCNLLSTLTLCKKPACRRYRREAFRGDSTIWFDAHVVAYGYMCDDLCLQRQMYIRP